MGSTHRRRGLIHCVGEGLGGGGGSGTGGGGGRPARAVMDGGRGACLKSWRCSPRWWVSQPPFFEYGLRRAEGGLPPAPLAPHP